MHSILLTVLTWIWNATLRRFASLILLFVVISTIGFILLRPHQHVMPLPYQEMYEGLRIAKVKEHASFYVGDKNAMEPVPLEWTARDRCPACLGTEMCEAIERKEVHVEIPMTPTPANKKGVYIGKWLDLPVAVKRLSNRYSKEFQLFDEFVCEKATGSKICNVSMAIVNSQSYVQSDAAFSPENVRHAWKISYPESDAKALTYALCIAPRLMDMFSELYDDNNDGHLSPDEKAVLFTSMVVQPESLMLKYLKSIMFQRVSPKTVGACGRLVVIQHGGKLLSSYLDEPFKDRAELALQLLSLVQMFWHADRHWFVLYNDFRFDNVAVSHDKEIFLLDYGELSIIENLDFHEPSGEHRYKERYSGRNITCNDACFSQLFDKLASDKLSSEERAENCNSLHSIGGSLMYSTLCRNILSDIPEHRAIADKGGSSYRGLLHGAPKRDNEHGFQKKLKKALRECVEETRRGGHVRAGSSLADLLASFVGVN